MMNWPLLAETSFSNRFGDSRFCGAGLRNVFVPVFRLSLVAALLLVFSLSGSLVAQEQSTENGKDSLSLARAKQAMEKLDKDGNGSFEKTERTGEKEWRRLQKLDTNNDEVISLEELSKKTYAYLDVGGERKLEVIYKKVGDVELRLDLYYPKKDASETDAIPPVVVYTHGGGWAAGSKQGAGLNSFKAVFTQLLNQGFAVASVEYRLVKKVGQTRMRDCVIDSKDAIRYLSKNSETLKLDPNRFYTMGDSAGGQIAQILLLASPESLPGDAGLASTDYKMVAGVSWYGPCDFEKIDLFNHDDRENFRDRFGPRIIDRGVSGEEKLALYREMSPVNYLRADSPALLMIQGDKDTTIPVKHAYYMAEKAEALKAPVETLIVKNAGHNWRSVDAPIAPSRQEIIERTVKFFLDNK